MLSGIRTSIIILLSIIYCFPAEAQTFSITPDKPLPGETITVKYNPAGTSLSNSDKIELNAYTYDKSLTDKIGIQLQKEGDQWTGSFTTDLNDLGALIIFKNESLTDNNEQKGYIVHLYDKAGNMLPGSLAGLGYGYYAWTAWYAGFDRNPVLALEFMSKEFEKNPSLKTGYIEYYVPVAAAVDKENSQKIFREGAELLEQKKEMTENDYSLLIDFYNQLKDADKVEKYNNIVAEKYPDGMNVQAKFYSSINVMPDLNERLNAVNEFKRKFPESRYLRSLQIGMIRKYQEADESEKLRDFMIANKEGIDPYYFQNVVLQMIDKQADLGIIYAIASAGEDILKEKQLTDKKPEYATESEWEDEKEATMGYTLYAKGRTLYEMGKKNEALDLISDAAKRLKYEDTETNLYLSKTLSDLGMHDEALKKISGFIKEGNSSEEMADILKTSYLNVNGNTDGFESLLAELEDHANKKLEAKLMAEIINEPAPGFKLTNLDGKEFSLEQFKGKVVMIDFWATWCGPCKSSFPGIKKVVEKYSNSDNMNFLFINSWERVENKKETAQKFITDNSYPFNVLLDLDNQVIEKYKVSGIPTKFLIDKNGNIRFKSIGYSGDDNKMIAEMTAMISILQKM